MHAERRRLPPRCGYVAGTLFTIPYQAGGCVVFTVKAVPATYIPGRPTVLGSLIPQVFPSFGTTPSRPDHLTSLCHLSIDHIQRLHPFDVLHCLSLAWLTRLMRGAPCLPVTSHHPSTFASEALLHNLVDVLIVQGPRVFHGLVHPTTGPFHVGHD